MSAVNRKGNTRAKMEKKNQHIPQQIRRMAVILLSCCLMIMFVFLGREKRYGFDHDADPIFGQVRNCFLHFQSKGRGFLSSLLQDFSGKQKDEVCATVGKNFEKWIEESKVGGGVTVCQVGGGSMDMLS